MTLPPLNIPALLRQFDLRPDKRLGQNFLVDPAALQRVIQAANLPAGATVLEIGPGLGSLTRLLAVSAARVVAVELDGRLLPALRQVLAPHPNVQVVEGDILALPVDGLLGDLPPAEPYQVVANIPYYITSALIRHLLEAQRKPQRLVLTVQEEVARRICAGPGDLSLLALSVQVYGQPRTAAHIPAGAFYPAPQVDSAVLCVELYPEPAIASALIDDFFRLAKAGFGQKRKTLRNALAAGLAWRPAQAAGLLAAGEIDPERRAETLSLDEWGRLAQAYRA